MHEQIIIFSKKTAFIEICISCLPENCKPVVLDDFEVLKEELSISTGCVILADFDLLRLKEVPASYLWRNDNSLYIFTGCIRERRRVPHDIMYFPFALMSIVKKKEFRERFCFDNDPDIPKAALEYLSGIAGKSPAIKNVRKQILEAANCQENVLITGESGTGKSLAAGIIHALSSRKAKKLVTENVGAISSALIESELFGVEKGAYTEAGNGRLGLIENADGGTFFLDEIADLPPNLQAKLLFAVQEREIRKVGSDNSRKVDVRFIFATNQNLVEKIKNKEFRADLFYRISAFLIYIPPLRQRQEDIEEIAVRYLEKHSEPKIISPQALQKLKDYSWPGNVREMEHCLANACRKCKGNTIESEHIMFLPQVLPF